MYVDGSGQDGLIRKTMENKKNLSEKVKTIQERIHINSIIKDGKVTLEEAQSLGLNSEYDVSTDEGLAAFYTAYETVQRLKQELDEKKGSGQENPKFGLS